MGSGKGVSLQEKQGNMAEWFKDPVQRFKVVGYAEGWSFILLLGVAMPLKYLAGIPEAVKYTGWAHGVLFVLYLVVLLEVKNLLNWSFGKLVLGVLAAFLPFGPFLLEKRLFGPRHK
jgi:integral membrane protein